MSYDVLRADARCLPLEDESVDLIVTSPPYFALRSYRDGDEHYEGQIGSEPSPQEFLDALWACTSEWWRVLKPTGSLFVNLGDKYAGSGGHNNANLSRLHQNHGRPETDRHKLADEGHRATRRSAPDRYNQSSDVPAKSLMGLPWRYATGCTDGRAAPCKACGHGGAHTRYVPMVGRLGCSDRWCPCITPSPQQWVLRAEVVWSKPNGLPESVTDRVRRSHEQWFHLTKQGRYFAAVDEVREPHALDTPAKVANGGAPLGANLGGDGFGRRDWSPGMNPLGKLPGSVWTVATEPLAIPEWARTKLALPDHFAAFPQEWPRRIILGWSPSGICTACGEGRVPVVVKQYQTVVAPLPDRRVEHLGETGHGGRGRGNEAPFGNARTEATITGYSCACDVPMAPTRPSVILDPFGGTGTTAGVAHALGRHGVSVDLSWDYTRLARWRIGQSGHFAKTASRTDRERQGELL